MGREAESISAYLEQVELFFTANSIADDKKVAMLLSVGGGKTYSLLRDLLAPEKPQDKSLPVLFQKLKEHYEPKLLVIAERFYSHRRDQGTNESIAKYIAELRRLATNCEFSKYLNDALRDRLVCGLRNTGIQKRLLSEANLTLAKAGEIAQKMEAAEKNAKRLQGRETVPVNKVIRQGERRPMALYGEIRRSHVLCCGRSGHVPSSCRFRNATCHKCQKKGHIAKACRSRAAAHR